MSAMQDPMIAFISEIAKSDYKIMVRNSFVVYTLT